jgi:3',5'-cyclic-AMP phosphodiesterase
LTAGAGRSKAVVIAQFSDLHVMAAGRNYYGVDAAAGLEKCIAHLCALDVPPDLLVASGDLVDGGTPAEYARLRELLSRVRIPLCLMPGNHDRRAPLRQAFSDHDYLGQCGRNEDGRIYYYRDVRGLRIIALDSVIEGRDDGDLDAAQLHWLDALLEEQPQQAALVFLHHPPVATGFSRMDRIAVAAQSAERLGRIIAGHPQVCGVLCGHVHRSAQAAWHGTLVSVCPSTAFQAKLRLGAGRFEAAMNEPPAYQLHHWDGAALVTHTVTV